MRRGYLVTVNMQHLYAAYEQPSWSETFFHSPMARLCVDGRGARALLQARHQGRLPILAGNDALQAALEAAGGLRVLVIGTSSEAIAQSARRYPDVEFEHVGGRFDILDRPTAGQAAQIVMSKISPDRPFALVAIALGVGKQELLAEALAPLMDAPIFCIGGSFEMLAGTLRRAPRIVQRVGLEAVWRLLLQPNASRLERLVKSYGYYALFRSGFLDIGRVLKRRTA